MPALDPASIPGACPSPSKEAVDNLFTSAGFDVKARLRKQKRKMERWLASFDEADAERAVATFGFAKKAAGKWKKKALKKGDAKTPTKAKAQHVPGAAKAASVDRSALSRLALASCSLPALRSVVGACCAAAAAKKSIDAPGRPSIAVRPRPRSTLERSGSGKPPGGNL